MHEKSNRFGIDAFWLKMIAMLFMVIDHVHTYILVQTEGPVPAFLQYPGRIVSPIFFYFLVEGFFHTRSRLKYGMRLLGWSIVMSAGSWLLVWMLPSPSGLHNNIFLSLFFGLIMMVGLHMIEKGGIQQIVLGVCIAVLSTAIAILFTEASIFGVLCVLVFYYARKNKWILSIAYVVGVLLVTIVGLGVLQLSYEQLFLFDPQWMMVFALPFILLYNGKRGYSAKWSQYLFYVFYPMHLWLIYMIGYFMVN